MAMVTASGNNFGTAEEGPEQERPILRPLRAPHAQLVDGAEERQDVLRLQVQADRRGLVLAQEGPDARVVGLRRVDLIQQPAVALAQRLKPHRGDDVGRAVDIVAGHLAGQAVFLFHAFVEACPVGRLQQPDHRGDDAAHLDEIDLLLEDRGGVAVEADDEAALHLQAGALEPLDAFDQVAVAVLDLAAFRQAGLVRRFDADEDRVEARLRPSGRSSSASSARLMETSVLNGMPILPSRHSDQRRQDLGLQDLLVADEVVVDEEDVTAPAHGVQAVQFAR